MAEQWTLYICPEHLRVVPRGPSGAEPPLCFDHQGIPKLTIPFVPTSSLTALADEWEERAAINPSPAYTATYRRCAAELHKLLDSDNRKVKDA